MEWRHAFRSVCAYCSTSRFFFGDTIGWRLLMTGEGDYIPSVVQGLTSLTQLHMARMAASHRALVAALHPLPLADF
jgi:hypothetical protein